MAQFEFRLPDIGEGVTEGEIVSWLVSPGDAVQENQDVVEVMTDKATVTISAPRDGRVSELRGKPGDVVPVGSVLVVFDIGEGAMPLQSVTGAPAAGAAAPSPQVPQAPAPPRAAAKQVEARASAVGDIKAELPGTDLYATPSNSQASAGACFAEKPLAAPAVRKLARELGIDLRRVVPSGKSGQVTREDVEKMQAQMGAPAASALPAPPERTETAPTGPTAVGAGTNRMPIRGLRKRIYENMARAKHTAAHFTYVDECDAGELVALHARMAAVAEQQGVKLSYLPFVVRAVVGALRKHPALHCLVDDAALEMVSPGSFDIGIAMATGAGLIVPVLRAADRLNLLDIAREIDRLATSARAGKTRPEDLGGSVFTITSLGKLGGLFATPVVNYPEVAILGIHAIKRRPVVRDDQIVIGQVMHLSLSFDHRIIDGHVGAAFAQEIIRYLEKPERLLLDG